MSDEFVNDIDSIAECDDFELTHSQLSTIMLLLENFPYSKAASKDCTTFKDAFNIVITNKFSQKQIKEMTAMISLFILRTFLDEAFEANNSDIEETIKELDIEVTPEYIKSAISVISEEVKEVVDRFIGTEYKTFRKMLDGYEKLFESGSLKEYMKLVVKQNDIADLFVQFLDEISSFKYDDEDEIEEE